MKKIIISCGPIPSRIDGVNFITNKFKGGLSFKIAEKLINKTDFSGYHKYKVTILKWENVSIPNYLKIKMELNLKSGHNNFKIINIKDVMDYYQWFEQNAINYDVFILAATVENLTPCEPYEDKFPFCNYSVGEKFDIKFEIAPRAINLIKKINPSALLIGYKSYNAKTNNELINVAKQTLTDSSAELIFANTPSDTKYRKFAIMKEGAVIECNIEEHINLIEKLISSIFFKTKIIECKNENKQIVNIYKKFISMFMKNNKTLRSIAVKVPCGGIVTTNREKNGEPVYIENINFDENIIYADNKAILNAPALFNLIKLNKFDYVIYSQVNSIEHDVPYAFAGTVEESTIAIVFQILGLKQIIFQGNGCFFGYNFKTINCNQYYDLFPDKAFKYPAIIDDTIKTIDFDKILDIGCKNNNISGKYFISHDTNSYDKEKYIKTNYQELLLSKQKFDLIILKSSINYLTRKELLILKKCLNKNGKIIANSYSNQPMFKATENEICYNAQKGKYTHFFINFDNYEICNHFYFNYDNNFYRKLGFKIKPYGNNSILLAFENI